MKKYTSDEVIALYKEYKEIELNYLISESNYILPKFETWLKDKEESELPIKGQMIWVRDIGDHNSYYGTWHLREFNSFFNDTILCIQRNQPDKLIAWDEYSLTDPNE